MTSIAGAVVPVSVIVVSRHRTAALLRAISGLRQSDHPQMELIVVADPAAAEAVRALALRIRIVVFDEPNISAARNAGLALATAEVVAFLDDDAVPEPTWASRLSAVFADRAVVQAGGSVRGRGGLRWQWRAMEVDALGQDHPFDAAGTTLRAGSAERAIKTQGTNCAFRRRALLAAGGFDPAFRFYLDDADVNLRLATQGLSAHVPGAVVHHGFAASARRRADRVPTDLTEIAASTALFLRRHAGPDDLGSGRARLMTEQRNRALRHVVAGGLEPRDVDRLMRTLEVGWEAGLARPLTDRTAISPTNLSPLWLEGTGPRAGRVIAGRPWHRARLRETARDLAADGTIVTAICLSPTFRRHDHAYDPDGYWWHAGGLGADPVSTARFRHAIDRISAVYSGYRPVD